MLYMEDLFPGAIISVDAEQIPTPRIMHEPATAAKSSSAKDLPTRLVDEINQATKAWGLDKKGR